MAENDLSSLITSIDENDIEIISSDMCDQLDFVNDHFDIKNRNSESRPVSNEIIQSTVEFNGQDSEEFEDETIIERLYGLTEMFPNWLQRCFQHSHQYSTTVYQVLKKSVWFCSSSFMILVLPILIQSEFSQIIDAQTAETRQILLGPSAQIGSNSVIGFT